MFTLKVEALQSAAIPLSDSYQYDRVTHIKISEEQYTDASVEFRVPLQLDDGVLDTDSVSLSLFDSSWQELSAQVTKVADGYQYYEAEVPYFGLFGIRARAGQAEEARLTEAQAAPETEGEDLESAARDELEALSPPAMQKSMLSVKVIGLVVMLLSIALFIVMMVVMRKKKQDDVVPSKKTSKKIMKK